jgi:TfoX/Sxy family transcriptional regulator of competence genes
MRLRRPRVCALSSADDARPSTTPWVFTSHGTGRTHEENLMQIPKPSEADKAYFRSLVPENPAVEIKPMFGNLGAFVNGNMFMGLFGADVGLKLGAEDQKELTAAGGGAFGPSERPMPGYVSLPTDWRTDEAATTRWVTRALDTAAALPPKRKKSKAAR